MPGLVPLGVFKNKQTNNPQTVIHVEGEADFYLKVF